MPQPGAWGLAATAAILLVACRPASFTPLQAPGQALDPKPQLMQATGFGRLSLTIRWPDRSAQYLPEATTALEFKVYVGGDNSPYLTKTASRGTDGTATVSFDRLPAGQVTLTGNAKDGSGNVLSSGSVTLTIVPNALTQGRLPLYSTEVARLITMAPMNGDPGSSVSLFGAGFGASRNASYSVRVGGVVVPASDLTRPDDSTLFFKVPETATNSVVTIQVDQQATSSTEVFRTIRSWTLSPTTADVFVPSGMATFSAMARDWQNDVVADPTLKWTALTQSGMPGSIDPYGTFTAGDDLGSHKIRLGNGSAAVEATVATHAMTLADFADRLAPLGTLTHPIANPGTPEKISLGKALFFDPRLGSNGAMSCATCHQPNKGWGDGLARAIGNDGLPLERNSPTVINSGLQIGPFFWDGRAATLEDQAKGVFGSAKELNRTGDQLLEVLNSAGYQASFSAVFGAGPATGSEALDMTTKAMAAFERTVVTEDSKFDTWARGNSSALSLAEKRGLAVFANFRCIDCHNGPLFTDGKFHNISVFEPDGTTLHEGRKAITNQAADRGAFKTPVLRNVAETGPYFHTGATKTLEEAILHYESNFSSTPNIDPLLATPILLNASRRSDLEAFLRALSGATPSISP